MNRPAKQKPTKSAEERTIERIREGGELPARWRPPGVIAVCQHCSREDDADFRWPYGRYGVYRKPEGYCDRCTERPRCLADLWVALPRTKAKPSETP